MLNKPLTTLLTTKNFTTLFYSVGFFSLMGARLALSALMLNATQDNLYGTWVAASTALQMIILFQLCSPMAFHKEIAINEGKRDERGKGKVVFSAGCLLVFSTPLILIYLLANPILAEAGWVVGMYLILATLDNLGQVYLRAVARTKLAAGLLITQAMILLGFLALSDDLNLDKIFLVLSLSCVLTITVVLLFSDIRFWIPRQPISFLKNYSVRALKVGVLGFSIIIFTSSDFLALQWAKPEIYLKYADTYFFVNITKVLSSLIGLLTIPAIGRSIGGGSLTEDSIRERKTYFFKRLYLVPLLAIPYCIAIGFTVGYLFPELLASLDVILLRSFAAISLLAITATLSLLSYSDKTHIFGTIIFLVTIIYVALVILFVERAEHLIWVPVSFIFFTLGVCAYVIHHGFSVKNYKSLITNH